VTGSGLEISGSTGTSLRPEATARHARPVGANSTLRALSELPVVSKRFTLVELLVVVAIIALLAAILLPGLQSARDAALRAACASNLRQTAVAVFSYSSDHDDWMYASIVPYRGLLGHEGEWFLTPYDEGPGGLYGGYDLPEDVWRDGYQPYLGPGWVDVVLDPGDRRAGVSFSFGHWQKPDGHQFRYTYHAMLRAYPYAEFLSWSAHRGNETPSKALIAGCSQSGCYLGGGVPWGARFGWSGAAHHSRSWWDHNDGTAVYGDQAYFKIWFADEDEFRGRNQVHQDGSVRWYSTNAFSSAQVFDDTWRAFRCQAVIPQ